MTYDQVIALFGTQQAIAAVLGVSQPTVSDWKAVGFPYIRQIQLERITKGRLKAGKFIPPKNRRMNSVTRVPIGLDNPE